MDSLVGRALALCESMAIHGDGGTEVMALKLTNALHGLGQTAAIHKVLKGCSLVAAHSPEHRFVEGLACCAGGGAGDAMAATREQPLRTLWMAAVWPRPCRALVSLRAITSVPPSP